MATRIKHLYVNKATFVDEDFKAISKCVTATAHSPAVWEKFFRGKPALIQACPKDYKKPKRLVCTHRAYRVFNELTGEPMPHIVCSRMISWAYKPK